MATRSLSDNERAGNGRGIVWTGLLNGDDGEGFDPQTFADVSVHVHGTFGTGGTVLIEGSNQATPSSWATLADPQGNALSFTAEKIEQVLEGVRWIRPRVSAGDGTTSLTVSMWARRT